jgi:hypothetical protein
MAVGNLPCLHTSDKNLGMFMAENVFVLVGQYQANFSSASLIFSLPYTYDHTHFVSV